MKPHKHAAVIHAWADGAQVQVKGHNGWIDEKNTPSFNAVAEYRIKPAEKVVRWLWIWQDNVGIWSVTHSYLTESEFLCMVQFRCPYRKLDYTQQEFDE